MNRRTLRFSALVAILAMIGFFSAGPANAGQPPAGLTSVKVLNRVCDTDGLNTTLGGRIRMQEFGKHGVTQLKVTFKLYVDGAYVGAGSIHQDAKSAAFKNDGRNFYDKFPYMQFKDLSAVHSYSIRAKLTWKRPYRQDWNVEGVLVQCG